MPRALTLRGKAAVAGGGDLSSQAAWVHLLPLRCKAMSGTAEVWRDGRNEESATGGTEDAEGDDGLRDSQVLRAAQEVLTR